MDSAELTVESLISRDQFNLPQEEKERLILPLLKEQVIRSIKLNEHMNKFYASYNTTPDNIECITDITPLPVSMFKKFKIQTCADDEIVRTLNSSATTTGIPSKI